MTAIPWWVKNYEHLRPNYYQVLYIDFPWLYPDRPNKDTRFGKGMHRYRGLDPDECRAFGAFTKYLAAPDAALFMWHVAPKYAEYPIHEVMDWSGFRYINKAFTWIKVSKTGNPRYLPGQYTGSNSEDCFLGLRGSFSTGDVVNRGVNQVVIEQLRQHSKKPDAVRDRIVKLFGEVPRIELFATEQAEGFDAWGEHLNKPISS